MRRCRTSTAVHTPSRILAVAALLLLGSAARGDGPTAPPEDTLRRLEVAARPLDERDFSGSYRVEVISRSGSGDDPQERRETYALRKRGPDPAERDLLHALEDGEDVTERRREEIAGEGGRRRGSMDDVRLPTWEHRNDYVWEPLPAETGRCAARFTPAPSAEGESGVARGVLGWDCATLDPAWLEVTPEDLPPLVHAFEMAWRFVRTDGFLLAERFEFGGSGGFAFLKRTFRVAIEVSDFVLDPAVSRDAEVAGPAPAARKSPALTTGSEE